MSEGSSDGSQMGAQANGALPPETAHAAKPLAAKLNSYLHTKPEIKIGNPAIIWHRAYWKPQELEDDDWHTAIAQAYRQTEEVTKGYFADLTGEQAEAANDAIESIKPSESESFEIKFQGIRIAITFEVYEEFWSKKMTLDFSSFEHGACTVPMTQGDETDLEFLGRLLGAITWDMNAQYQSRRARKALRPDPFESHEPISADAMRTLSVQMSQALHHIDRTFFPPHEQDHDQSAKDLIHSANLRFADFIGHSLGLPGEPLSHSTIANMRERNAPFPAKRPDGQAARVDRGSVYHDDHLDDVIEASWGAIAEVNPVISGTKDPPSDDTELISNIREFSLTLIDRRRALYVSSLGRAGSSGRADARGNYQPLAYMILAPHQARWQIGRIIDTVHNMGMYRLAAMHQYEVLAKRQNELRLLQDEAARFTHKDGNIQAIDERFSDLLRDPQSSSPDNEKGEGKGDSQRDGEDRPDENAEKQTQWPADHKPAPVGGSLRYRLDWSESYVRSYWRLVDGLRTERVEGYQQYREFIVRNLSDNFENIDMVRARVDYLDRFIASRYYTANQEEMKGLQGRIGDVLTKAENLSRLVVMLSAFAAIPALNALIKGVNPLLLWLVSLFGGSYLPITFDEATALIALVVGTILAIRYRKFFLPKPKRDGGKTGKQIGQTMAGAPKE